jgi:hypothetical protein
MAEPGGNFYADLPVWAQYVLNAGIFVGTAIGSAIFFVRGKKGHSEEVSKEYLLGAEDITDNKVVRRFLELQQKIVDANAQNAAFNKQSAENNERIAKAMERIACSMEEEAERREHRYERDVMKSELLQALAQISKPDGGGGTIIANPPPRRRRPE